MIHLLSCLKFEVIVYPYVITLECSTWRVAHPPGIFAVAP